MKTVGIVINGRLGSTRCPRKLIRPFDGTTLFEIAMKKLSLLSSRVNVYTGIAEQELIEVAERYPNVEILHREMDAVLPGYGDHKKIYAHYENIKDDYIMWLNPCHPLISEKTIMSAINDACFSQRNSYTSVVETNDWIFNEDGTPLTNTQSKMLSTDHSKKHFKVAHAFHIINKAFFLKEFQIWTLTQNDPALIEIPAEENFDVNTELEFSIAEMAYSKFKTEGHVTIK